MNSPTDELPGGEDQSGDLIDRAVAGDQKALSDLLEMHGPSVRRTLTGRIDRRWQAVLSEDDVMQETYADAFLGVGHFRPQGEQAFLRWLTTLARNNLLDAVRSLQTAKNGGDRVRLANPGGGTSHHDLLVTISASLTTPSRKLGRKEDIELLERGLNQLPASYRDVVVLYDLKGLAAEDAAAQLGCSPGALYMRRSRAHAMLADLLLTSAQND